MLFFSFKTRLCAIYVLLLCGHCVILHITSRVFCFNLSLMTHISYFHSVSLQFPVKASMVVNDSQQTQTSNVYHEAGVTRNKIVTAQFECYQKIMQDNTQSRQGSIDAL